MILSEGTVFRNGMRIKDFGERVGHVKVFGKFIFHRLSGWIVGKGLDMKNSVRDCRISKV